MAPWLNPFCFAMGLFTTTLFAYLASLFLVGETTINKERLKYVRFSKRAMILTIVFGTLIFVLAELNGQYLIQTFLHSVTSIVMLLIASLLCPILWHFLNKEKNKTLYLRVGAGIQVCAILMGWFAVQFPVLIKVQMEKRWIFIIRTSCCYTIAIINCIGSRFIGSNTWICLFV